MGFSFDDGVSEREDVEHEEEEVAPEEGLEDEAFD